MRKSRSATAFACHYGAVVRRGLNKTAPLHQNKNSVADAPLIELYATTVLKAENRADQ